MARWIRRAVVLGVVASAAGLVASACADNEQSLFIRQVQAGSSGQCAYTADPSGIALGQGVLDLMITSRYRAALLVGNQLVERGSPDQARAETSRVQMHEAEVRVELPDGTEIKSFTIPGNGFVDPSNGAQPGWGLFLTELIDWTTAKRLRELLGAEPPPDQRLSTIGRVVAVVKVYGKTLGGRELETGEFRFPIEVCYGCSVSFPPDRTLQGAGLPEPNCGDCGDTSSLSAPCVPGQDEAVDCCLCKSYLGSAGGLCEP
jgi:hypothetical protein